VVGVKSDSVGLVEVDGQLWRRGILLSHIGREIINAGAASSLGILQLGAC
jgi:hypothetical protein